MKQALYKTRIKYFFHKSYNNEAIWILPAPGWKPVNKWKWFIHIALFWPENNICHIKYTILTSITKNICHCGIMQQCGQCLTVNVMFIGLILTLDYFHAPILSSRDVSSLNRNTDWNKKWNNIFQLA